VWPEPPLVARPRNVANAVEDEPQIVLPMSTVFPAQQQYGSTNATPHPKRRSDNRLPPACHPSILAQRYLDAYHMHLNRIIKLTATPLRVPAAPILIALDQSKTVLGSWVGKLASNDEDKVLQLVRSGFL
jgi:hypothetical protein